jgi:hypothetical protein
VLTAVCQVEGLGGGGGGAGGVGEGEGVGVVAVKKSLIGVAPESFDVSAGKPQAASTVFRSE